MLWKCYGHIISLKFNWSTVLKEMYLNFTLAKYTPIKDIKRYEGFPHYYRTFKWLIPPLRGIAWKTNILASVIVRNRISEHKLIDDLSHKTWQRKKRADKEYQS